MELSQSKNKTPVFKILIILIVLCAIGYYMYSLQKDSKTISGAQGSAVGNNKEEAKDLANKVSKLVLVDTSVVPDIVTITDASTMIKQQPVFSGVINGDKILVYIKEKRAIVFSPSRNVVVNILPITMQKQPVDTVEKATTTNATTTKAKK